ncbi:J domain-containing protein [Nocardia salmonicida]|uniref:J domain-containing protein n=1 Tax=Nocardia salmonicida TaxID=53431 RepID=UPI00366A4C08
MSDFYALLGLPRTATDYSIKSELVKLQRQWMRRTNLPDLDRRQEAEQMVRRLSEARAVLLDPVRRAEYDRSLPGTDTPRRVAIPHDVPPVPRGSDEESADMAPIEPYAPQPLQAGKPPGWEPLGFIAVGLSGSAWVVAALVTNAVGFGLGVFLGFLMASAGVVCGWVANEKHASLPVGKRPSGLELGMLAVWPGGGGALLFGVGFLGNLMEGSGS